MIQPHTDAPDGLVTHLSSYSIADFTPDSVCLCRNTAPLVRLAFGCVRRNLGVKIAGRELGENLTKIVEGSKATTIDELQVKAETLREREVTRAIKRNLMASVEAIEDKYECLGIFMENASSIESLLDSIKKLFNASGRLFTLSTIHRAKGLEWPTVFLLDRGLIPSKYATQPWQLIQEINLLYVAVTRAQHTLHPSEPFQV